MSIIDSICLSIKEDDRKRAERPVEHPDCKACGKHRGEGNCPDYKTCTPFREWFSYEWRRIREAARRIKEAGDGKM